MLLSSPILSFDRDFTLAVNGWHTPFCDQFFYLFSSTLVWAPLFIVIIFVLFRSYGWRTALSLLLAVGLAVLLSDQFCNLLKYTVCRFRPTHEPSLVGLVHTVNGYVGGDYGFCSSHAANTVAITVLTSLVFRRWAYTLTLSSWVFISCWSRIYLGVHYLGDILCGLLVGSACAVALYFLWRKTRWCRVVEPISSGSTKTLICSYFITVLILLAYPLAVGC